MRTIRKKIVQTVLAWLCDNTGWTVAKIDEVARNDLALYYRLYEREDVVRRRFYNIGAGEFNHPAWTNIDHASEWYKANRIDIDVDLTLGQPLPIDDDTANIVYSSHTIEHLPDVSVENLIGVPPHPEASRNLTTRHPKR